MFLLLFFLGAAAWTAFAFAVTATDVCSHMPRQQPVPAHISVAVSLLDRYMVALQLAALAASCVAETAAHSLRGANVRVAEYHEAWMRRVGLSARFRMSSSLLVPVMAHPE